MAQRITKNSFEGLRNTDTDNSKINSNQYLSAFNLEFVGDGKFLALQNIKGTTNVQQILGSSTIEVLGVFPNKYLILGVLYDCLTIFTATPSDVFKIWCYNTQTDILYELFEESIGADYLTEDRVIDAVNYPENGVDFLYFTDFFHEVRFLKCVIPDPFSDNFLSAFDISLLRKGAVGTILLSSVDTGGSLLTGVYQFSYRMVDPTNKRFTKWSTLTNPIHVYDRANGTVPVNAGIGLLSDRKIILSITPSTIETDEFDFFQLAVVEAVGPTIQDINGVTSALPDTASLLEITSIPGISLPFEYKTNSRIGTIPLSDITVDLAQIETVKTLNVKENRLFGGNIKYTSLDFDNGVPTVTGGSILRQSFFEVDGFSSDDFSSRYVGYFRDEVYRLGIVYEDAGGNKSTVQPLDLSGASITGNTIAPGLPDIKFPDRSVDPLYSVWAAGNLLSLGLTLNGIINHPTWARAFEIVRVRRKKNILFQTPLIPMTTVQGIGALSAYPTRYVDASITGVTVPDAQPQTSGTILIPKNLFWPEKRIVTVNRTASGSGFNYRAVGEAFLISGSNFDSACIFPQPNMYGDTPFVFTGAEKINYVDYALLRLDLQDFSTSSPGTSVGDFFRTSIVGNFNAVAESQYYFDSSNVKAPISATLTNIPISDYEFFDNGGEPASLAGISTLDFDAMQTKGIGFWQTPPTVQRMAVIKIGGPILQEPGALAPIVFAAGTLNIATGGGFIVDGSGPKYEFLNSISNRYVNTYTGFGDSQFVSALPIVNINLGLGDDRYGDINAQHEYISTGARHTFTPSEIATLQAGGPLSIPTIDVWGGDCFVASHTFKVCDSTYSVINQTKNNTPPAPVATAITVNEWGAAYLYNLGGSEPTICLPIAVENSGQYVQVVLESEYNGGVRDIDTINYISGNIPVLINNSKESIRTPLSYKYNLNLSRQNFQKIYFPNQLFSFKQNDFIARIIFSDIKIYNSEQAGFDLFRVGNIHDLEEKRYGITKLSVASDSLYAIQEQGIVYIPTGERQIEATDGGTLSVRSGDVIGRVIVIDSSVGSQHLRGIVETGQTIFIPDNESKDVYVLSGQQVQSILENNESEFRTFFATILPERNVIGIYDHDRKEYWLIDNLNNRTEIFNEKGGWVGQFEFTKLFGGVGTNQKLYLLGRPSGSLDIYEMYTGPVNNLFGLTVVPRVTFSVNPDEGFSKTIDDVMFDSSDRLSTVDFVVERESSLGNQTVIGTSIDSISIEGNFRLKSPRDSNFARLRGLRALVTVKWKDIRSALKAVYSKYRLSARTPW